MFILSSLLLVLEYHGCVDSIPASTEALPSTLEHQFSWEILLGELLAEEKPARWPRKRMLPSLSVKCLCSLVAFSICAVTFLEPVLGNPEPEDLSC